MDKTYYKELIEKYFEGNITDDEIKELSGWIKNDRRLQDWWEDEFSRSDTDINPILRDKLFARIKDTRKREKKNHSPELLEMGCRYASTCLYRFFHLLSYRFFPDNGSPLCGESQ